MKVKDECNRYLPTDDVQRQSLLQHKIKATFREVRGARLKRVREW